MADKPVGEVVAVDAVLDGLSSPTSSDVYEALLPFSNDAAVASAASLALAGGGGGSGPTIYTGDAPIDGVGTVFKVQESDPSTSGTFTLTFRGDTTDPIAFDASSTDILIAFGALASVNGNVAIVEGYEGLFLNVDAIRFVFTGALLGETEDPTVTNDLTDNGVTVGDISTGSTGDPVAPALNDLYVAGASAFVYVFDGGAWNVTRVASSAITTVELADGSVTTAKLAGGAVTNDKIANGGVHTANLADGAVTRDKITPPLSYRDPLTTTVSQLITVMIAGNLMEPS